MSKLLPLTSAMQIQLHTPLSEVPPRRFDVAPATGPNAPAVVTDYSDATGKRAVIWHPDGPTHPNHIATRERLLKRGYAIVRLKSADAQGVTPR